MDERRLRARGGFLEQGKKHWVGLTNAGQLVSSLSLDEMKAIRAVTGECRALDIWEKWQMLNDPQMTVKGIPRGLLTEFQTARNLHWQRAKQRVKQQANPPWRMTVDDRRAKIVAEAMQRVLTRHRSLAQKFAMTVTPLRRIDTEMGITDRETGLRSYAYVMYRAENSNRTMHQLTWAWFTDVFQQGRAVIDGKLVLGAVNQVTYPSLIPEGVSDPWRCHALGEGMLSLHYLIDGKLVRWDQRFTRKLV